MPEPGSSDTLALLFGHLDDLLHLGDFGGDAGDARNVADCAAPVVKIHIGEDLTVELEFVCIRYGSTGS